MTAAPPRPRGPGRVSKLTPALLSALVSVLTTSGSIPVAAASVGLTPQTVRNWLEWGLERPSSVYGDLARALDAAAGRLSNDRGPRPATAHELNDWFDRVLGVRLGEVAVCPGHSAPIDFVFDLFAHRVDEALVLASRTAGKTLGLALLHVANGYWKAGHTTTHFGSVENQARRAYAHFKRLLESAEVKPWAPDPGTRHTDWLNGSSIEILPGTENQTQGPHTHLVSWDELESGERQPYENARGIPEADPEGHVGQFVTTSTRQKAGGLMQQALDAAPERGARIYTFCVWETIRGEAIPAACDHSPADHVNRDDEEAYYCPQPLARYAVGIPTERADGWRPLRDVMATYRRMARDTFETQVLNLRPDAGALILPNWSESNVSVDAEYVPGLRDDVLLAYDVGYNDPTYLGLMQIRGGRAFLFDEVSGQHQVERHWIREAVRRVTLLPDYVGPSYEDWEEIWMGRRPFPRPWPRPWLHATGDPAAGHMREELSAHGIGYSPATTVRHELVVGLQVLRSAVATDGAIRLWVHPRCSLFIAAAGKYEARELPDGSYAEVPSPEPSNHRWSHPLDAVRYMIYRWRRELEIMAPAASSEGTDA